MPTLEDFMLHVVPWPGASAPGYVNIHWRVKDGKSNALFWGGRPHTTPSEFVNLVTWALGRPTVIRDLYFCLSLQGKTGKYSRGHATVARSAADALALKSIWLDIDVKAAPKGYPSIAEALQALKAFVAAAAVPWPNAIVASGGGLHVYWISDRSLTQDEWRPYAEGLKAAAIKHGFRCDYGVTTDPARVLRIPGTLNYKTDPPKPVKLLSLDPDYNFEKVLPHLSIMTPADVTATVNNPPAFDLSSFAGKAPPAALKALDPKDSLASGIGYNDLPPLDPAPIFKGCPFYRDAFVTHGRDHSQPLWNLTVLGTVFMRGGNILAHELGNGHPGYSPASTDAMYTRKETERQQKGLGWPSCKAIEGEGCKLCATCPHKGIIKSPLKLALSTPPPPAPHSFTPQQVQASPQAQALQLPRGYGVDPSTGIIGELIERPGSSNEPPGGSLLVPLFNCVLKNPWAASSGTLQFDAQFDPDTVVPVAVTMIEMATTTECIRSLAKQRCKHNGAAENRVRLFLMAWLTELTQLKAAMRTLPFGWWHKPGDADPHGFVYAGKIVKDDGTESPSGYADSALRERYAPTGSLDPWIDAMRIFTGKGKPDFEAIMATAFAAPLMKSTGQYSCSFSAWGESGSGKTTALQVAMAVWGHPKLTKETVKSTAKSVLQKMGHLRNIPIFWDEISDKHLQEQLYSTMFSSTEGVEGSRLFSDVTQRGRGDWQTVLVACSNISFVDFLATRQKSTDAGVNRVFEFKVKKYEDFGNDSWWYEVSRIAQKLEYNFGNMGLKYAQLLGSDPAGVDKVMVYWLEKVSATVNTSNPERYWAASVATLMAGAQLANTLGAEFNLNGLWAYLIDSYYKQRERCAAVETQGGSMGNTMQILNNWLRSTSGNSIWTKEVHMGRGKPKAIDVLYGPNRDAGREICNQWATDARLLLISRSKLFEWMEKNDYGQTSMFDGLKQHLGAKTKRIRLGAGTTYALLQEVVISIDVPSNSPLREMLYAHTPYDQRPPDAQGEADVVEAAPVLSEDLPAPVTSFKDALANATEQAANDLELVRKAG